MATVPENQVSPLMLAILATLPEVPAKHSLVSFARKSTKKNPVPDSEKERFVLVPEYSYTVVAEPTEAQEVFSAAVQEAFESTAGNILQAYCIANKFPATIDAKHLTFSAVLAKMSEQATSTKIKQDAIFAWYDQSDTAVISATRYGSDEKGKSKQVALRAAYGSLASNNPGIDAALAIKMLSYLSEKDTSHMVCSIVAKKLSRLTVTKPDADEL